MGTGIASSRRTYEGLNGVVSNQCTDLDWGEKFVCFSSIPNPFPLLLVILLVWLFFAELTFVLQVLEQI